MSTISREEYLTKRKENRIEKLKRVADEKCVHLIADIIEKRIKLGLSQRQLADLCGMEQSAIARIEMFKVVPRLDTLFRIAEALNLKVSTDSKGSSTIVFVPFDYNQVRYEQTICWEVSEAQCE